MMVLQHIRYQHALQATYQLTTQLQRDESPDEAAERYTHEQSL